MGLLLLRKGSQSYIGLVFNPFDPPTRVVIVKRKCVRLHANTRLGAGGGGGGGAAPQWCYSRLCQLNRNLFLVQTTFFTFQNYSWAVIKLQRCRQEYLEAYNLLSGDKILCSLPATLRRVILFREHDHETFLLVIRKTKFHMSQMRTRLQKRKIGDYKISNFWQTANSSFRRSANRGT